jgi:Family of unknown function (DUF6600)/FecR protein
MVPAPGLQRAKRTLRLTGSCLVPTKGVPMTRRTSFLLLSTLCLVFLLVSRPAAADSSHVRIVRISLVEGDVRVAYGIKGDPLASTGADWDRAVQNLPIRQGYVLATDNGRAEVEFENGAMAFLAPNSVLEFYDLSLTDGSFATRLVLRQGSATFYANPEHGAYFSVTGGDFTVEADGRGRFRMDNFDDGSSVGVEQGRVNVVTKDNTQPLGKNEMLSVHADDPTNLSVGRISAGDDFDKWVSSRVDSVVTATNASLQYAPNSVSYTPGFGDLYTYGSWFPVAGYGYCWRPFGVGLGWSPFDYGSWAFDPVFGWNFVGSQPWGWLPYHFGGWLFQPGYGWVWTPAVGATSGRGNRWRPVTGVWVRSGGTLGLVPAHPMDKRGKTPMNIGRGITTVSGTGVSGRVSVEPGEKWKVLKSPPRDAATSSLVRANPPERVARTITTSPRVAGAATRLDRDSSIAYDSHTRRFVNSDVVPRATFQSQQTHAGNREAVSGPPGSMPPTASRTNAVTREAQGEVPGRGRVTPPSATTSRETVAPARGTQMTPPPRAPMTPPPPARTYNPPSPRGASATGGGRSFPGASSPSPRPSMGGGAPVRASPPSSSSPRSTGGRPH